MVERTIIGMFVLELLREQKPKPLDLISIGKKTHENRRKQRDRKVVVPKLHCAIMIMAMPLCRCFEMNDRSDSYYFTIRVYDASVFL